MKKNYIDLSGVELTKSGRVVLGSEMLENLERNQAVSAGAGLFDDPLTNSPLDDLVLGLNLVFCRDTINTSIICATGVFCERSTNNTDCRNGNKCEDSKNNNPNCK